MDLDFSSHTLAYVNEGEDVGQRNVITHFALGSHGVVLPLRSCDMFSFQGLLLHGTIV